MHMAHHYKGCWRVLDIGSSALYMLIENERWHCSLQVEMGRWQGAAHPED